MIINRDFVQTDAPPPVDDLLRVSASDSISPQVEHVIVFVDGGCVQNVFNGEIEIDYSIVDYDCQEGGECPICWKFTDMRPKNNKIRVRNWLIRLANKFMKHRYEYEGTYTWCPKCEVNWDDPPTIETQVKLAIQESRGI